MKENSHLFTTGRAICCTSRHTLPINAGIGCSTVVIASTSDSCAFYFRIACIALFACAHWLVIFHPAICIRSARTRFLTDVVNARFMIGTFTVRYASTNYGSYWFACAATATNITRWTHTDHSTHWDGWYHLALSGVVAWFECGAWFLALWIEAGE